VVPEAFGMVAAEAAACGVLPVVPDHSGIAEAGAAIEERIGMPGFLTFDSHDPVNGIAAAVDRVLSLEPSARAELGRRAAELARERWAWSEVAGRLLSLATGDGDRR
jgi:glycosyltransferase involved in cell wall biosynthesis